MRPLCRPEISVLIPSHNRRELLRRCLESLAGQTAEPASFEVIVADDGSEDGTERLVRDLPVPFRMEVVRREKEGKSAVLNAALDRAAGRVCLFLDDDVVADPELVAEHLRAHLAGPVLGIGAIVELPPQARDWFASAFARGWEEHNADLATRPARWTDCYGANFSAPLATLQEIGGFTVGLAVGEDFEIGYRLWRAGLAPTFLPAASVVHDDQKRGTQMLADARKQGAAHVELARKLGNAEELLAWGRGAGTVELLLRRACLKLGIPPHPISRLGRFLPGQGRRMIWLHFVRRLAFWRGAMEAMSAAEREALTRRQPLRSRARALVPPLPMLLPDVLDALAMAPL